MNALLHTALAKISKPINYILRANKYLYSRLLKIKQTCINSVKTDLNPFIDRAYQSNKNEKNKKNYCFILFF